MWNYKTAIWLKAMRDTAFEVDLGGLAVVVGLLLALVRRRLDGRLGWAGWRCWCFPLRCRAIFRAAIMRITG
jgi:hypothetical protein